MKKILALVLVCMMLIPTLGGIGSFASSDVDDAVAITGKNMWVGETLYPMFAVTATEGYDVVVKTTVNGTTYTCVEMEDAEVGTAYVAPYGVAAWNITYTFETTPYLYEDGELVATGETITYSVLQYLFERLYDDKVEGTEKAAHEALIAYATAADAFYNEGANEIASYVYVKVEGVSEGTYQVGDEIELYIDAAASEGMKYAWNVADTDGVTKAIVENGETYTVGDYHAVITAVEVEESAKAETTLAIFTLGSDGNASHKDGSTAATDYSETVGDYTLSIKDGNKMYPSSYDATGNGCIKFGTSSAIGSMTFTVPANVTKVYIEVAKYKANTTKIEVNGTAYTLASASNNGEYDVIEVDTSETKTVTFATVSGGVRCMMNSITFYGSEE